MKLPSFNKIWTSLARNKFAITLLIFIVWLSFFDSDNWMDRYRNIKNLEKLKAETELYKMKVEEDRNAIKEIQDPKFLEKFAREQYFMKKDNEDIYIIVEE